MMDVVSRKNGLPILQSVSPRDSFHGNNESMETAETAAIYSSKALVFRPQSKVFISSDCYFAHQRAGAYCTTFRRPQCLPKPSFIGLDDNIHHDVASANSKLNTDQAFHSEMRPILLF